MKSKMLITLSICLLLFSCGDKKQPAKKVKQKTVAKIPDKPKQETKKEKVLDALPAKKEEHVHGPGCGHEHNVVASSEHISTMMSAQEHQMKMAEMLPDDIREEIQKMVAERNVKGLTRMCNYLSRMGDFDNAFLIASNFLAYAETETEKQMANSFYANLATKAFRKHNKERNDENEAEYENIKLLLIESLEKTPDKPNIDQAKLVEFSLYGLFGHLYYENNVDTMYKIYDMSSHKINKLPQNNLDLIKNILFSSAYIPFQHPEDYDKIRISNHNLDRLLKFSEDMIAGRASTLGESAFVLQKYKKNLQGFKNYRLEKRENKTK